MQLALELQILKIPKNYFLLLWQPRGGGTQKGLHGSIKKLQEKKWVTTLSLEYSQKRQEQEKAGWSMSPWGGARVCHWGLELIGNGEQVGRHLGRKGMANYWDVWRWGRDPQKQGFPQWGSGNLRFSPGRWPHCWRRSPQLISRPRPSITT